MNDTDTATPFYKRVAERHARLTRQRAEELRYATGAGPKALADIALKLEYIDGRLNELDWAHEQATGHTVPKAV